LIATSDIGFFRPQRFSIPTIRRKIDLCCGRCIDVLAIPQRFQTEDGGIANNLELIVSLYVAKQGFGLMYNGSMIMGMVRMWKK